MKGTDKSPEQYKLYGSDSELEEVASEPNRVDIDVQTWTGSGAKYFVLSMKLRDSLNINPYMMPHGVDNILLKNTVYFTSGATDPIVPLKVKYYVTDPSTPAIVQSAYQGNVLEQPAAPAGYRVEGWFTEYDSGATGRQWVFAEDHLDKVKDGLIEEGGFWTLKLYAKYSPIQYSIVCHYPDGTVIGAVRAHYTVETDTFTIPNPSLTDYTFIGWSGTDIKDKSTNVVISKGSTGDREYTANWSYLITFHANNDGTDTTTQTMEKGKYSQLQKNTFTKGSLIFYGWSTSPDGDIAYLDTENVIDLGDADLYAIWGDYLSITYKSADPGDGTPPSPVTNLTPKMVKTVSGQGGLTKLGFIGWIDISNGKFYAPESSIEVGTANIILEAVYSDCFVAFDRNGGSGTMTEQRISSAVYLPLKHNTFTRTGYAFYGWNTQSDGLGTYYGDGDMISPAIGVATINLYAIWGHSIEYDDNGGTGTVPSNSVVKENAGVVVKPKPDDLHKTGCVFKGWNTMADGTGVDYAGGETIASLTSNIKLYAVWECTVTFSVVYNASNPPEPYSITKNVVAGTTVQLPSDITYNGHTLTAWESGGTLYLPGRNVVINGNMTFTTVWADVVTITYNHGTGGTGEMPAQTVLKGVKAILNPNEFTCSGKAFYGWSLTDGGAVLYKDEQVVTLDADVTLYAVWKNYVSFSIASLPESIEVPDIDFVNEAGKLYTPDMGLDGYSVIWYKEESFENEFIFIDDPQHRTPSVLSLDSNHTLYGKVFVNVYFICSGQKDKIGHFPYGVECQIDSAYLFQNQKCWNTRNDGLGTYYANNAYLTVMSPLGLYAIKTTHSNSFTVSFNANGGTGTMSDQTGFVPGTTQLNANTFTMEGYVFYKWNTAADCSGTWFSNESRAMISKDTTLYAIWKYKVNYDGNGSGGGTPVPSQDVEPFGSVTASACTYTKTGFSFYKWNTKADGSGHDYYVGDSITLTTGNVTLYAVWAYAITFDINGGDSGTAPETMYCLSGKTITLPDSTGFSKDTNAFYQWNTNTESTGTFYPANTNVSFDQELILYASWGHSITYLAPDATGGEDVKVVSTRAESVAADDGSSISRDGYTFRYWTTGEHGTGTSYIGGAEVPTTANITLYAQWNAITYTISYELNGGIADPGAPASYDTTAAVELRNPTYEEFRFAGWSGPDLNGCNNNAVTIPAGSLGNRTYTAHWEQYTVSFDSNGGYGVMIDQALITDTLNANTFAKKGYTFSGWNTAADGSGKTYTDGAAVTLDGNLVLYAQWTVNTYSITYDNNGATVAVTTPATYDVTTATITLGIPEKTDFTFGGWYTDDEYSGDAVTQIPKGSMGDRTFYAKWDSNPQP